MSADLEQLLEDGVIDEVVARLKSGKEADVWLVRHGEQVLAAKVYKDRNFRSFKNNSGYKEGRAVRNSRTQRAMDKGSRFGQAAAEDAWKSAESDALHKLHAQGVRVPAPVLFYEGILLMHLVHDGEGNAAPRLIDAIIPPEQAAGLYQDLRTQAIKMLCADLIHGDLSAYNVLLGAAGPTIIDFPQVVSAAQNSTAESFFKRDIENLRGFFAGLDRTLETKTAGDAHEIWHAYVRRDLAPDFVPSGRPPPEPRRQEPRAAGGGAHHKPQGKGPRDGPRPQHAGHAGHGGGPKPQHAGHAGGPKPQHGGHGGGHKAQHAGHGGGPKPQPQQAGHGGGPRPQHAGPGEGPKPAHHGVAHGSEPRRPQQTPHPPGARQQQGRHGAPRPPGAPDRHRHQSPSRPPPAQPRPPAGPIIERIQRSPPVAGAKPGGAAHHGPHHQPHGKPRR